MVSTLRHYDVPILGEGQGDNKKEEKESLLVSCYFVIEMLHTNRILGSQVEFPPYAGYPCTTTTYTD
jgi:hypothetical protein